MSKIWTIVVIIANVIVIPIVILNALNEITSLLITTLILVIYFRSMYIQRQNRAYIENLQYAVYKNKDRITTLEKTQKKLQSKSIK